MLKEFLSQRGIKYSERDVSTDRAAASEVMRLTGQLAVPVTVVDGQTVIGFDRPRLEQLLAKASQGPSLGAAVGDAARITRLRGLPPAEGAFVGGVKPGSAAQRLGLAIGDVITEVNGRPVKNPDDLEHAVSGLGPGSRILLVYLRDGSRRAAEGTF
jgi:S1-C subfamily serine protease